MWRNAKLITLDIDWASEEIIDFVAEILISNNMKATWFITHDSISTRNLFKYPNLFDIGIHPNFLKNSTQGKTPEASVEYLLNIYPNAKSVRPHALVTSGPLLEMLNVKYNLEYDSSVFLYQTPNIVPHQLKFNANSGLIRLPYFWGDNYTFSYEPEKMDFKQTEWQPGLKIFSFHPIHIAANAISRDYYDDIKKTKELSTVKIDDLNKYKKISEKGTHNFFLDLIENINEIKNNTYTLKEIGELWKKQTLQGI